MCYRALVLIVMSDDTPDVQTVEISEPSADDYKSWYLSNREEIRDMLIEAGASEYLLRFIDTVDRGARHSVLMTLFRHNDGMPTINGMKEAYRLGGGFMTKLWDGHLADAYCHADGNNRPMMEDAFTQEEVVSVGLENDGPFSQRDYLSNLIDERWG